MADYMNVKDLNLEQKEEHDRYDKLDLSAIEDPDVEEKEHDRVENPDSIRQTPVAQANESKGSTDKSMERGYVTLVENGPGKVLSTVEKRPTSSLIPNRTGKKKQKKEAPQLETTDKDGYDSLYRSAIEDLDLERSEGHDTVEGRHSTGQTSAVQSTESKRSVDNADGEGRRDACGKGARKSSFHWRWYSTNFLLDTKQDRKEKGEEECTPARDYWQRWVWFALSICHQRLESWAIGGTRHNQRPAFYRANASYSVHWVETLNRQRGGEGLRDACGKGARMSSFHGCWYLDQLPLWYQAWQERKRWRRKHPS